MPFVKTTKTNAYFKRFQTKFRRRREYKTDYYARKRMCNQDLNKYGTPKFRLVSRITNAKVIAQVVYSKLNGDYCVCQANSKELSKWGLQTGYTSYAAAYATGLLCARRLLQKYRLADMYKGVKEIDGKDYDVSADADCMKNSRKPFKAILDIGTCKATAGNRVFGVLKGACDGGLHVPHNVKRYPGFHKDEDCKKGEYNAEVHKDRILGCHIDEYMEKLKGSNEDAYKKQFSRWEANLNNQNLESVEDLFVKVHEGIRKDPAHAKKERKVVAQTFLDARKTEVKTAKGNYKVDRRFTYDERKKMLQMNLDMIAAQAN